MPNERYYHELLDNSLLYFHHSAADLATRDRLPFRALIALLLPLRKIDIHSLGPHFKPARKLFMVRKKAVSPPPPPPMVVPYAHAKRLAEVVMVLMTIDKQLKKAKKDKNKGSQDPTLIKDRRARKFGPFYPEEFWPFDRLSIKIYTIRNYQCLAYKPILPVKWRYQMKINYFIALIGVFLLFNIGQSCAMKPASRPSIEEALQLAITNREDAINRLEAFAKSADIREASLATGQLIKMGQIDRLNSLKEASKKKHSQQSIRAHIMLAIYNANSHNIEDLSTSIRLLTRALKEIEAAPRTSSFPADYAPYCRNFLTQFFGVNSTVLSDAQITEQASEALWRITQENRPSDMEAILNRFMKNKSNPYYYHAAAQLAGLHCAQLFQQSSFDKAHHLASLLLNQSSFPLLASGHFILGELAKFKGKYEDAQNHLQQAAGFGLFIPVPAMQLISLKAKISLADLEAKKDISRAIAMLKGLIPIESRFGLMSFNALRTKFLLADYLMAQDSANSHESKAIYEEIANQDEVPGLAAYAQRRLSELTTPAHLTQFLQETLLHQAITIEQNSPQEARSQSSAESKSTKLPTPQLNTELPMDDHVSNDNTQQADEDRAFDLEYHQLHEQLLTAIKRNQPTRVRELLKQGADPFYLIGSKRIIDHAIACAENDAIITLIAPETAHPSTALPATHATYQIEWNKEAKKQFDKLQGMEQNKIHEALEAAANKLNPHVKKLQGKQPFQYRIAVGNRLRIGFNYSDDGKGIVVMYAGYHEHCYE